MSSPSDPSGVLLLDLRALENLALAERQLDQAAERIEEAALRAGPLADDTDWRTETAVRFHRAAERWRDEVWELSRHARSASADVRAARDRLAAQLWGVGR